MSNWKPGDLRVWGTTVLSCGCGIPWGRGDHKNQVRMCKRGHGVVVVIQIR